ncbi:MAG: hypothetical protein ACOZNI_25785 [Myxococcota bacterium]
MALLLTFLACNEYKVVAGDDGEGADIDDGTDTTGTPTEEDYSEYDGATLVVVSPASGDFLPYGDTSSFEAVVYDAEGNEMDFDDISWKSDIDSAWLPVGSAFEDDTLDVGTHALTATAELPNGDRLAYTIGGVLVQSAYTGVYTGEIVVNVLVDYDGTSYEVGCSGATTIVVDAYGETATGDAGCLLSLMGYELDTAYVLELENDDGELSGVAAVDLSFYQYDMETEGEVTEDGDLSGTFADDVFGYAQLDGTYTATRVSRDISEYQ